MSLLPFFFKVRLFAMKNKNPFPILPITKKPNNAETQLTCYIQKRNYITRKLKILGRAQQRVIRFLKQACNITLVFLTHHDSVHAVSFNQKCPVRDAPDPRRPCLLTQLTPMTFPSQTLVSQELLCFRSTQVALMGSESS